MPRLIGEQRRLLWTRAFGRCGCRWVLGDALEPFVEPLLDIGPRTIGVHFDVGTVKTEPTIERAEANGYTTGEIIVIYEGDVIEPIEN